MENDYIKDVEEKNTHKMSDHESRIVSRRKKSELSNMMYPVSEQVPVAR